MARGSIKVTFDGKNGDTGDKFARGVRRYSEAAIKAIQSTTKITAEKIERDGRESIARAGNFSSDRWQLGLRALVSYQSRVDLRIRVTHRVRYWRVFEYAPTTIHAKNPSGFLWIPLDFARDAQGVMARDFPGGLFRIDRQGKAPLLLSVATGEPKYFGKESVTIRTRWRVRVAVRRAVRTMKTTYQRELKKFRKG